MPRHPLAEMRGRAEEVAIEALTEIEGRAGRFLVPGRFLVHLDVDVIDSTNCPIADVRQQGAGLEAQEALSCLKASVQSPKFARLTSRARSGAGSREQGRG